MLLILNKMCCIHRKRSNLQITNTFDYYDMEIYNKNQEEKTQNLIYLNLQWLLVFGWGWWEGIQIQEEEVKDMEVSGNFITFTEPG